MSWWMSWDRYQGWESMKWRDGVSAERLWGSNPHHFLRTSSVIGHKALVHYNTRVFCFLHQSLHYIVADYICMFFFWVPTHILALTASFRGVRTCLILYFTWFGLSISWFYQKVCKRMLQCDYRLLGMNKLYLFVSHTIVLCCRPSILFYCCCKSARNWQMGWLQVFKVVSSTWIVSNGWETVQSTAALGQLSCCISLTWTNPLSLSQSVWRAPRWTGN